MSEQNEPNQRLMNIILVIAGLACGLVGAGFTYVAYTYSQTVVATNGIVTQQFVENGHDSSRRIFYLVISFSDQQDLPHVGQVSSRDPDHSFPVGTELSILYDPDILVDINSFSQIKLNKWFEVWGIGFIFSMVGIFTMVAVFLVYRDKRKRAQSAPL
ncbi:MAG: hypothetical protein JKY31_02555 [Rhodobacteraceae bacterium]|nr:hypothetical protein [Paracoccaceae bacterium]